MAFKPPAAKTVTGRTPSPPPSPAPLPPKAKANGGTGAVATKPAAVAIATNAGFASMAGAGFENAGRDDFAIPFLVILQSGSPQCKRSDGAYIPGAAEGMLLNSVTKQVIDTATEQVIVVPCAYDRSFVEWVTREDGGGFVRQLPVAQGLELQQQCERDEKNRDILPNGHQLNDTRSFYVMVIDDAGNPTPAFLTMTSTQIKKAKQWLMQQNLLKLKDGRGAAYTPPMFAAKWQVTTVPEQNEKGSWYGWAFEFTEFFPSVDDPTFQAALLFHKSVTKGDVRVDLAKAGEVIDSETGEVTGNGTARSDKDPARAM